MVQNVTVGDIDADWPGTVAEYIRHNDEAVLRATDKLLNAYQNDFLNCGSFDEFCDVAGKILFFYLLIISIPHCDNDNFSRFIGRYSVSR
jgi:hypothetical protein